MICIIISQNSFTKIKKDDITKMYIWRRAMTTRYFICIWNYPDSTAKLILYQNFAPKKVILLPQAQFFLQGEFVWVVMPDGSCHELGQKCNSLNWGIDLFDLVEITPG